MNIQNHTNLQSYLDASGVLQWGNDDDIRKAKTQWRKLYQKEYKQHRRYSHPTITVSLSKDEKEHLKKLAKAHHLSLPKFLKKAALSYLRQSFLVPHPDQIARIEQMLRLWYTDNQRLLAHADEDQTFTIKLMQQRLTQLESLVEDSLRNPQVVKPDDISYDYQIAHPEKSEF